MVLALHTKTSCAGCALSSPLVCSEHQQVWGGVHHPSPQSSLKTEMSQFMDLRKKLLYTSAHIPFITGDAKSGLEEQKCFVHDSDCGLPT